MSEPCCERFPWCRCPIMLSAEDAEIMRRPQAPFKINVPLVEIKDEWVKDEDYDYPSH